MKIEFFRPKKFSLIRITVESDDGWHSVSMHFGVFKSDHGIYRFNKKGVTDGDYSECFFGWLWGRATEVYDFSVEYFGIGPIAFFAWNPGFTLKGLFTGRNLPKKATEA